MKDFYLDLYSSGSKDVFPQNKGSSFKNRFQAPIRVPPNYEVGLAEVSYVNSFETISFDGYIKVFDFFFKNPTTPVRWGTWYENTVSKGHYASSEDMANEICRLIEKAVPRLKGRGIVKYSPITQKFSMDVENDSWVTVFIFGKLLYTLGATSDPNVQSFDYIAFGHDKHPLSYTYKGEERLFFDDASWETKKHKEESFKFLSQVQLIDTFVVYIDIIEPQIGPDGSYEIIRTCGIKGLPDQRVIDRFDIPHYLPVARSYFEVATVAIKDVWGNEMAFQSGFVRLKLHFRQSRL